MHLYLMLEIMICLVFPAPLKISCFLPRLALIAKKIEIWPQVEKKFLKTLKKGQGLLMESCRGSQGTKFCCTPFLEGSGENLI